MNDGTLAALAELERAVEQALRTRELRAIELLGYGESTLVLACHTPAGRLACKRLPLFGSAEDARAYGELVARYAETLRQRGVPVMETEFAALPRPDGTCAAYCVQRAVPRESLLTNVLARCGPDEARAHFEFLFEAVVRAISDRVGFDADISNWCVVDGRPFFFDLSTPMLRDEQLREQVDYGLFLPSLPAFVRWFISERTAAAMLAKFYSPRAVALDVLCGLMRERVGRVSAVMLQANRRVAPPITAKELRRYYVVNQSIWALFRKLRRLECWWSLSVRHRSYPYLLPPATAFAGHLAAAQVFRRGLD